MWKQLLFAGAAQAASSESNAVAVSSNFNDAAEPGLAFISYSIELSSFPDFAGNKSNPNTYSYTLLQNIEEYTGTKPYIRVGGNTQDYALYDPTLQTQLNGTYNSSRSNDYPTTIYLGASFFESYQTWPGVKFSHGFNLAEGGRSAEGWQALVDTAPLACKAIGRDNFYAYEYGNEPNNFVRKYWATSRPPNWGSKEFVYEWHNGTKEIRRLMREHCPDLGPELREFMAPSYDNRDHTLDAEDSWRFGLNRCGNINTYSVHNYIDGADSPGVTLQHTLMNHTRTTHDVDTQAAAYRKVMAESDDPSPPLIFGETNSLYHQGKPGLSNSFGAALWGVDFNMYSASAGYARVHMHQGTNYRYQSWQPIDTEKTVKGTKAPYYGNIAAAAALGNLTHGMVSVASIPMDSDMEAAYAIYVGGRLRRLMAINMHSYNTTKDGAGVEPLENPEPRPSRPFSFLVSDLNDDVDVDVQRLIANGSDAITGITFDGWSYNWELDAGRPVRLNNVTIGESMKPNKGVVSIQVPDSSAAVLHIDH